MSEIRTPKEVSQTKALLLIRQPPRCNTDPQPVPRLLAAQTANRKQETGKENSNRRRKPHRGCHMDSTVTLSPATRRRLQQRRRAETFDMRFRNQMVTVTVGFYADDTLGEVFIGVGKSGTDIQSIARDASMVSASPSSTAFPSRPSPTQSPATAPGQPRQFLARSSTPFHPRLFPKEVRDERHLSRRSRRTGSRREEGRRSAHPMPAD